MRRWTTRAREAKNNTPSVTEEGETSEKNSYRHNLLCMAMYDLSQDASLSEEGFELVMTAISTARKNLSDLNRDRPAGKLCKDKVEYGNQFKKLLGPRKVISKGRPASKKAETSVGLRED